LRPQYIMFLGLLLVTGLLLSYTLDGAWFTGSDESVFNALTLFRPYSVFGVFNIPIPNLSFATVGLPKLFDLDFAFFGGWGGIVRYFLYIFIQGALWGVLLTVLVVLSNLWRR
jgi:hypothetical protein